MYEYVWWKLWKKRGKCLDEWPVTLEKWNQQKTRSIGHLTSLQRMDFLCKRNSSKSDQITDRDILSSLLSRSIVNLRIDLVQLRILSLQCISLDCSNHISSPTLDYKHNLHVIWVASNFPFRERERREKKMRNRYWQQAVHLFFLFSSWDFFSLAFALSLRSLCTTTTLVSSHDLAIDCVLRWSVRVHRIQHRIADND